jgi:hypothetical protein
MTEEPVNSDNQNLIPESEREMAKLDALEAGEGLTNPEDLPPVEPPSAGFIIQLFLIPAIIVIFIVGIWALFGKIASGEQDWKTLVVELGHDNEQRSWRAATSLAHLLDADERRGSLGQDLANNPEIARELVNILNEQLKKKNHKPKEIERVSYVLRATGRLNDLGVILPVLKVAMKPEQDREIKKEAITSIARISGRNNYSREILKDEELVSLLIETTKDEDPLLKQLSSFTLGLLPSERTSNQLQIMLNDTDEYTRINAAIGLARQHSRKSFPVLLEVIKGYEKYSDFKIIKNADTADKQEKNTKYHTHLISLKNCIKSVEEISGLLTEEEKGELQALLKSISEKHSQSQIQEAAQSALKNLSS